MTAYRVVDDHKELDNVGSLTHDQLDSHVNSTPFLIVSGVVGSIPPSARLLSGSGITITDGGPGGTLTLTATGGGGSGTPGGNDAEVQFNDGGSFGGDPNFTFDKSSSTLTVNNLSGSLTRLADGSSYLVAGNNISIFSGSNGQITISSTASGGGDPNASYLVLSTTSSLANERSLVAGTGLSATDAGPNGNYTLRINDSIVATVSGTSFSGVTKHAAGLSGSLTKLVDGSSYLVAGPNVLITSNSNGSITIEASGGGGGGGSPGGFNTYVQFNDGGSFGGDPNFTFDKTADALTVTNLSGSLTTLSDGSPYLIAGPNITLSTASNGSITISSTANSYTRWMEVVGGDADGLNTTFTLSNAPNPPSSTMFFVNGVLQKLGSTLDYTLAGNTITTNFIPNSGSYLLSTYQYQSTVAPGTITMWMENPVGVVNGINNIFTLSSVPSPISSLMFFVNGVLQKQGPTNDYTLVGNTITMNYVPNAGSNLAATYQYQLIPVVGTNVRFMETPSGDADGVNMVFGITNTPIPSDGLMFFVNGVLQRQGASYDYVLAGTTITMISSPGSGSNLLASYPY